MDLDDPNRMRTVNFVVLLVMLGILTAGLGSLTYLAIDAAAQAGSDNMQKLLARLAWVSLSMLCITLLLLFWIIMRFFRRRFRSSHPASETPYVDAWSLAGERFKLDEEEEGDPDSEDQTES